MMVYEARAIALEWVTTHAAALPGFRGAFVHGSANWLDERDLLPAASDLDVMIVLDGPAPDRKPGKLIHEGLLLEVSFIDASQLRAPDQVLGAYHLAGSFRANSVLADPYGELSRLHRAVARDYARRPWVEARCEDAANRVLAYLAGFDPTAPFHAQVTTWLFATGVTTHVLLVAGLKNPTVRTRYLAARTLLAEYGDDGFYLRLLTELGCAEMSASRASAHLDALTGAFDAAAQVIRTPFVFSADIGEAGRAVALDGSRALIAQGNHREAIFWIVATFARCQQVLAADAPDQMLAEHDAGFRALMADLGIISIADVIARNQRTRAFLPEIRSHARGIIDANPAVVD